MYQALYRKYRPLVFGDVVGQEHIITTLKGSLKSGKISHAYLFTGTRGTGKTTCAKILAKAVCCENPIDGEPCGECASCKAIAESAATDILEIDAASNNGVNDIRDLREQVKFLPVALKYRVYIIDETHMLSTPAFNALLKTLEEPPKHVIFILATTEVHKLPATILSRCQRFDFRRIEPETICERMNVIAEKEGFTITKDAGVLIAQLADGGMRDALSVLDQCAACGSVIDENLVSEVCGIASNKNIFELVTAIKERDPASAIKIIDTLYRNSVDMKKLLSLTVSCFRNLMIIKTVKENRELIVCSEDDYKTLLALADEYKLSEIINCLSSLQFAVDGLGTSAARSEAELAIVKLCTPQSKTLALELSKRLEFLEKTVNSLQKKLESGKIGQNTETNSIEKAEVKAEKLPVKKDIPLPEKAEFVSQNPTEQKTSFNDEEHTLNAEPVPVSEWPEIMAVVKKTCPLMGGVLAGSRAFIGGGRLLIDSKLAQFKELINSDPKYRDYIRKAAEQVLGVSYNLGPYKPIEKAENQLPDEDPLVKFAKSLNKK